MRNKNNYLHR